MEQSNWIDIQSYFGEDFKAVIESGEWKIGLLRYSERFSGFKVMERHLLTDEVFVLLDGEAQLYIKDEQENIITYQMKKNHVYNVRQNVWHHIVVSEDATVLVVENRNTSKENTEKTIFDR